MYKQILATFLAVSIATPAMARPDQNAHAAEMRKRERLTEALETITRYEVIDVTPYLGPQPNFSDYILVGGSVAWMAGLLLASNPVQTNALLQSQKFIRFALNNFAQPMIVGGQATFYVGALMSIPYLFRDLANGSFKRAVVLPYSAAAPYISTREGNRRLLDLTKTEAGRAALVEIAIHDRTFYKLLINLAKLDPKVASF